MGQVHPIRALNESLGLRPRVLLVSTNNSATKRYEDRLDFALIERSIKTGWCRWVCFRSADRIARAPLPLALFYDLLQRFDVTLYLSDLGRAVDWSRDRLELGFRGLMSAEELVVLKERTLGALDRGWLADGRGWPGKRPFGFRRNWATKFLEPDPAQWGFVKFAHLRYSAIENGGGGGLRRLAEELFEMGCEISPSQLRRLLRDPIYVTGDYSVRRRGATHPGRRIPLGDPIPGDTFERNQELLSLRRGRENRTPIGTFCLNAVPVIHARCAQAVNARGLHAFLRGRVDPRHDARSYRHSPFVPPGCRGFSIDQGVLEGLVIRELRSLASNEALKVEFEKASGGSSTAGISVLTREDRRVLEVETRGLERRRTQLARGFRARVKAGEEHNELAYWELLGGLTAEIDQIRRRLSASDSSRPCSLLGSRWRILPRLSAWRWTKCSRSKCLAKTRIASVGRRSFRSWSRRS